MAVAQIIQARKQKNMECDASVEVGDLVYLHPTTVNAVITSEDNNSPSPVIGMVIAKNTSTNARVLLDGLIRIDTIIINGRLYVGLGGGIAISPPTANYLQEIGSSFGDGIIDFSPVTIRVKRTI